MIKYYHLVFEKPFSKKSEKYEMSFEVFNVAKHYAKVVLGEPNRYRKCYFYSVDNDNNTNMIGIMESDLVYKESF
jgi:hypothetical protein